jgi:hypothetical protein
MERRMTMRYKGRDGDGEADKKLTELLLTVAGWR